MRKSKMFAKLLSLLLCAATIFCALPLSALAAEDGYYAYTVTDGKAEIAHVYQSISGDVTIPSTLGGYPVTSIGARAFGDCDSLTSITIPDSVTSIGDYAFYYCKSLTSITVDKNNSNYSSDEYGVLFNKDKTELIQYPIGNERTAYSIPDSVTSIGDSAFAYCTSLESITIPDSVTSIGDRAFYECASLVSITIPNSVTSIGDRAFALCTSLTSITVDKNNSNYSNDEYGVLFNKDKIELIQYPIGNERTAYSIPDSVTSIGDYAFTLCTSLTSITIPNSVTNIGLGAFTLCTSLTSITIPNSVTNIGLGAFFYCTSLTNITIPNSVTSIGDGAFEYCTSLTSITIPDSVTSIGVLAFYECASLKSVTIGNGVTSIAECAFNSCTSLTSITIPDSVTSIGEFAFSACTKLTSITIPNSVTSIDGAAFYECASLADVYYDGSESDWEKITIGDENNDLTNATIHYNSVKKIVIKKMPTQTTYYVGDTLDTSGLTLTANYNNGTSKTITSGFTCTPTVLNKSGKQTITVTYEGKTTTFEVNVEESLYAYTIIDAKAIITDVDESISGDVTVPSTLGGYPVTSIGDWAFSNCDGLTSITIPDSVKSIGDCAFYNCDSLTSITIPNSVTSIGACAFEDCKSLESVTIPNSVTSIGDWAFNECTGLESVTISNSVTSIGKSAFAHCKSLASVTIPNSVTSIGDEAFNECTKLTSITVDKDNPNYSSDEHGVLFNKDKTELIQYPSSNVRTAYSIPDSVVTIGKYAFNSCDSFTSITIPDSVTSIGDYAFYYCKSLTSITIPDSVTSIGDFAFIYCRKLTSITVDKNNSNYSSDEYGVLFNKDKTELIQYPIGNERTTYSIPNNVTSIGEEAFFWCTELTSVTIPNSVTSIGDSAFCFCDSLTDVYYDGSESDWKKISIGDYNNHLTNATIHYNSPEKEVTSIAVKTNPSKTAYFVGDTLDTSGLTLTANYNNGTSQTITSGFTCTPTTLTIAGKQTITVTYAGKTTTFDVNVNSDNKTAIDMNTGIMLDYTNDERDGEVTLDVKETFEDSVFQVLDKQLDIEKSRVFNITMKLNGLETQPNGKVTVRIPLPYGYDSTTTFVYHIDSKNGTIEKMKSRYENGYIVFETDHFSYYAVTQVVLPCSISVRTPSVSSVSYGDSIVLHADTEYVPAGGYVKWTADNGNFTYTASPDGATCTVSPKSSGKTTFTATVYDGEGNAIESATQQMTAKAGFFDKILAFFKNLFGLTKVYPQMLGLEVK